MLAHRYLKFSKPVFLANHVTQITSAHRSSDGCQRTPIAAANLITKNAANHCTGGNPHRAMLRDGLLRCLHRVLRRRRLGYPRCVLHLILMMPITHKLMKMADATAPAMKE